MGVAWRAPGLELYSDPSGAADDRALAEAIARAGNVVVGAQLIETADAEGRPQNVWLRPLDEIEVDADHKREMSLTINDEAKRLAQMIDEYLDITRLESGARPLRLTSTQVAQLIERALTLLDPVAARREMRVTRRFAPNLPALQADADLIARAVTNLVANAIKFSPPQTAVSFSIPLTRWAVLPSPALLTRR